MLLAAVLRAACIIVVKFDGSLQRSGNALIGTYAAAIHVDDVLLGLGGRLIEHQTSAPSSAIVEYEGLLYGLEQLAKLIDEKPLVANEAIVVQGDCKTVIEQLQGRARPRKLDAYHQRSVHRLERFVPMISFEHIPREHNVLADELANCIADRHRAAAVKDCIDCIGEFAIGSCTHIDKCLSAVSRVDPPARLAVLRTLARLCYHQEKTPDLLIVADKILELLKDSQSLFHVQDALKLDASVEAHVYRGVALEGKQAETFQRKTKHFVRSHSERIRCLEKELESSLEWSAMESALTAELAADSKRWSDPVKLWLNGSTDWVDC